MVSVPVLTTAAMSASALDSLKPGKAELQSAGPRRQP